MNLDMETTWVSLLTFLTTFCLYAQSERPIITLTAKDVQASSVRVITKPDTAAQNLLFHYAGKTSAEVEAIVKSHPRNVQIMKDGVVVTQTTAGCAAMLDGTNYVGLVLLFNKYDQAKLAEKTLRGR